MLITLQERGQLVNALGKCLDQEALVSVCEEAGLDPAGIRLDGSLHFRWRNVIVKADSQGPDMLERLLDLCIREAGSLRSILDPLLERCRNAVLTEEVCHAERTPDGCQAEIPAPPSEEQSTHGRTVGTVAAPRFRKTRQSKPLRVVIRYLPQDHRYFETLLVHLALLKRQELITTWSENDLLPGQDRTRETAVQLRAADIVVLLVSSGYLASAHSGVELTTLIERQKAGDLRIVPIRLRAASWHGSPLEALQACPSDGQPLVRARGVEACWVEVVNSIRRVAEAVLRS